METGDLPVSHKASRDLELSHRSKHGINSCGDHLFNPEDVAVWFLFVMIYHTGIGVKWTTNHGCQNLEMNFIS
jgi:hypothetical protein